MVGPDQLQIFSFQFKLLGLKKHLHTTESIGARRGIRTGKMGEEAHKVFGKTEGTWRCVVNCPQV